MPVDPSAGDALFNRWLEDALAHAEAGEHAVRGPGGSDGAPLGAPPLCGRSTVRSGGPG